MLESELDSIFPVTEIGRTEPFENPFGTAVYLDENLLQFPTVVFCPKMLSGKRGECFRLPIRDFQELVHPVVVRLSPSGSADLGNGDMMREAHCRVDFRQSHGGARGAGCRLPILQRLPDYSFERNLRNDDERIAGAQRAGDGFAG